MFASEYDVDQPVAEEPVAEEPAEKKYNVLEPIEHAMIRYEPGSTVMLSDGDAELHGDRIEPC